MPSFAPIAVVGTGAIFPGAMDFPGFWKNILAKKDLVTDVPESHWRVADYFDADPKAPDKTYARRGAFLPDVPFDAMGFGVPPSILPATDTSQLLALIVAKMVLDDIGKSGEDLERTSVILGVTGAQELLGSLVSRLQRPVWERSLRELGWSEDEVQAACSKIASHYVQWQESSFPGLLGNVVAGRIANRLDVGLTNCVTDAACASALTAVHMACLELHAGHSDMVITGGVDTMNDIFMYMCFSKTPALSPTGDCRPFDHTGDGTLLGEGIGMVALKRLDDAERDGDKVYAVIRGMGSSSDGRAKSVYAPVPEGQAKALRQAYAYAGYAPETVELVEAHGTATKAGDAAELRGLQQVFQPSEGHAQWCALGSIKSQIGHTKAAAGIAGMLKVIAALQHKTLPPTIKVSKPTPSVDWAHSAFYVNTEPRPWVRGPDHPRRGSVSSFGFGGSNFHCALEEYRGSAPRPARMDPWDAELVVLSAHTHEGLLARIAEARGGNATALALHGQTHPVGRHRVALVVRDDLDAKLSLAQATVSAQRESAKGDVFYSPVHAEGAVAFLFPGQGSQALDMGAALHRFAPVADTLDEAEGLVPGLAQRLFPRPSFSSHERKLHEAELTRTEWAQPALGAVSVAMQRLLGELGLRPAMTGGHSFGELVALHVGGAMDFGTLMKVARLRGECMARAASLPGVEPGAMAAVMGPFAAVAGAVGEGVVLANLNAPEQTVIAGAVSAVEASMARLEAQGLRATRLPVATAFHSHIVAPAGAMLTEGLRAHALAEPKMPVFSNTTAAPHGGGLAEALGEHLRAPVRWVEEIEAMYAAGARVFVEVGPGSVLTGLVGRILKGKPHVAVAMESKGRDGFEAFLGAVGRLVGAGVELSLAPLAAGRDPGPTRFSAQKGAVPINGANYGKPWPRAETPVLPPNPPRELASKVRPATPTAAPSAPAPSPPAVPPTSTRAVEPSREPTSSTPAPVPASAAAPIPRHVEPPVSQPTQPAAAAWLVAFTESQRQLAEVHARFGQSMADAHMAFLRAQESSAQAMVAMATGQPPAQAPAPAAWAGATSPPLTQPLSSPPALQPALSPPAPTPTPLPVAAPLAATPTARPVPVPTPAPVAAPPPPTAAKAPVDLRPLLLEVVADKTGYPAEMLRLEMNLEADLGIDSIKRVEILSAVRERAPGLPEPDAETLGRLHTLGQIVEVLGQPAQLSAAPAPAAAPAPGLAAPATDLAPLLLAVVAEKTGYPAEMLRLDMNLEADLGIDSIKRVEILSAVRERAPELPEPDAETLGRLHTLGQIVEVLVPAGRAASPATAPGATTPQVAPAPPTSPAAPSTPVAAPVANLEGLLLSVVAEKTGYPAEMLRLDMNLEADLGIDSIKRVEILSAVRERAPDLPEPDAETLGRLHTLGQIVEVLSPFVQAPPTRGGAANNPPPSEPLAPLRGQALQRLDLALVPVELGASRGLPAVVVSGPGAGVAAVAAALARAGVDAREGEPTADRGVVFVAGEGQADATVRAAFLAAKAARLDGGGAFVVLTRQGGRFGLDGQGDPWLAGLYGLAKTVALEHPSAVVRVVDADASASDDAVVAAVLAAGPLALGLAGELCTTPESVVVPSPHRRPALGPADVVVVSGGARGVTAACVIELAVQTQARFVLLGRSRVDAPESPEVAAAHDEPALMKLLAPGASSPAALRREVAAILAAREANATVQAVHAAGGQALYLACDVCDPASVASALDTARQALGPITGVVHGAGVIHDRRLEDKTEAQWNAVWSTKIEGARALLAATANDDLKVLCFFSSVAARTGNVGQADYAAANEALNRLAAHEQARRPGCVVKSIGWGPWEGGMVTPALARQFHARGIALIPLIEGARAFVDELGAPGGGSPGPTEVVIGGLLAGDGNAPSLRRVNSRDYPFLRDHSVADKPVVPVVMAVEWFAQRARELSPGAFVAAVDDVRVLKGITLHDFEGEGHLLAIHTVAQGPGTYTFELRGGSHVHYRAVVRLTDTPPASPPAQNPGKLPSYRHSTDTIYQRLLFHGPGFQAIRAVDGVSPEAADAALRTTGDSGWPTDGWLTDLAAGDGGLQLAVLWSRQAMKGASLPTAIGSYRPYGQPSPGPARGILRGRKLEGKRSVSDVSLVDATGRVYADLVGVELHALPGGEYPGKAGE